MNKHKELIEMYKDAADLASYAADAAAAAAAANAAAIYADAAAEYVDAFNIPALKVAAALKVKRTYDSFVAATEEFQDIFREKGH